MPLRNKNFFSNRTITAFCSENCHVTPPLSRGRSFHLSIWKASPQAWVHPSQTDGLEQLRGQIMTPCHQKQACVCITPNVPFVTLRLLHVNGAKSVSCQPCIVVILELMGWRPNKAYHLVGIHVDWNPQNWERGSLKQGSLQSAWWQHMDHNECKPSLWDQRRLDGSGYVIEKAELFQPFWRRDSPLKHCRGIVWEKCDDSNLRCWRPRVKVIRLLVVWQCLCITDTWRIQYLSNSIYWASQFDPHHSHPWLNEGTPSLTEARSQQDSTTMVSCFSTKSSPCFSLLPLTFKKQPSWLLSLQPLTLALFLTYVAPVRPWHTLFPPTLRILAMSWWLWSM